MKTNVAEKLKVITPANQNNVQVRIETITPEIAKELLQNQARNRKWKRSEIDNHKSEMTQGNWQINGQTIVINNRGQMVDGQHRLMALIESGMTLPFIVVRGVAQEAVKTIDVGRKRSMGDIFQMQGVYNSRRNKSIITMLKTNS